VQTLALLLLLAFLMAGGGPGAATVPPEDGGEQERAAVAPAFSAGDVAEIVGSWNSNLDEVHLRRIGNAVMRYSRSYGLEPELVTAVLLVESSGRPWARSPKGALGLMQVMPHMMDPLRLAGNATTVESNIEAGCWILAHNIRRLGEERGISAYFWGGRIGNLAYLEKVREARTSIRASSAAVLRPS